MLKKALKWLMIITVALAVLVGGRVVYILWKYEEFKTPVFETQAPDLPVFNQKVQVLVFSKTNSYRHLEGIPAAESMFEAFAEKNKWDLYITENAAIHNAEQLAQFDVIIWNSVTGDVLTADQKQAFQIYMEQGGKFLGLHGTGGNPDHPWSWLSDTLIKGRFSGHPLFPQFRDATLITEDRTHPVTSHMPERKPWHEEWYSYSDNPRENRVSVFSGVDETEYDVSAELKMGKDHPLIWHHRVGKGTVFYSSLGHLAEAYDDQDYRLMMEKAVFWLLDQDKK